MIVVRGLMWSDMILLSKVKVLPNKLEINVMVLVVSMVTEVEISLNNAILLSEVELLIDIVSKVSILCKALLLSLWLNVLKMILELIVLMSEVELLSESVLKANVVLNDLLVFDTVSLAIELLLLTINPV